MTKSKSKIKIIKVIHVTPKEILDERFSLAARKLLRGF